MPLTQEQENRLRELIGDLQTTQGVREKMVAPIRERTSEQRAEEVFWKSLEWEKETKPEYKAIRVSYPQDPPGERTGWTMLKALEGYFKRSEALTGNIAYDYVKGNKLDMSEMIENTGKALSGEKTKTWDDVINNMPHHEDLSKLSKFTLSFILSSVGDPLNWIPASKIKKGTKYAGRMMKKAFSKVPEVGLLKYLSFFSDVGEDLGKFKQLKWYVEKEAQARYRAVLDDVQYLNRGISFTQKDREMLSYFREHPDQAHRMSPELLNRLGEIGKRFDDMLERSVADGVVSPETAAAWRAKEVETGTPYLAHIFPEQYKPLRGELPPSIFSKVKKPTFTKHRVFNTLEDIDAFHDEFIDLAESATKEEFWLKASNYDLEEYFNDSIRKTHNIDQLKKSAKAYAQKYEVEHDILKIYAFRSYEDIAAATRDKFVNQVMGEFGHRVKADIKTPLIIDDVPHKIYLPKGSIRFYSQEVMSTKFADEVRDWAAKFERIKIDTREAVKRTPGGTPDTGPIEKMKQVVHDSLVSRGITPDEAKVYIRKLEEHGASGADDVIHGVRDKLEEFHGHILKGDEDIIDIDALEEQYRKRIVGVTKRVQAYALPEHIAKEMNNVPRSMYPKNPLLKDVLKVYDHLLHLWKAGATSFRLPFHLRNMYSNIWQMWARGGVAGKDVLPALERAIEFQTKTGRFWKDKVVKYGGKEYTRKQLLDMMKEYGVVGGGWFGSDIYTPQLKELQSILKYGKARSLAFWKWPREFGTTLENNARIATFLHNLKKGVDPKAAGWTVKKTHFDYSELNDLERGVLKRIYPWYTWERNNLPQQLHTLLVTPKKYATYFKAKRAFEQPETEFEQKFKPKWFDEMLYIKSPFNVHGKGGQDLPIYMSLDMPPLTLNRLTEFKTYFNSLSPAKTMLEIHFNVKQFPEKSQIYKDNKLDAEPAPWPIMWFPDKVLKMMSNAGIIFPMRIPQLNKYTIGMKRTHVYAMQQLFPVFSELNRIYSEPISLDDVNPELKKRTYLTGIGHKAIVPSQRRKQEAWETLDVPQKIRKFMMHRMRMPTQEELNEMRE